MNPDKIELGTIRNLYEDARMGGDRTFVAVVAPYTEIPEFRQVADVFYGECAERGHGAYNFADVQTAVIHRKLLPLGEHNFCRSKRYVQTADFRIVELTVRAVLAFIFLWLTDFRNTGEFFDYRCGEFFR